MSTDSTYTNSLFDCDPSSYWNFGCSDSNYPTYAPNTYAPYGDTSYNYPTSYSYAEDSVNPGPIIFGALVIVMVAVLFCSIAFRQNRPTTEQRAAPRGGRHSTGSRNPTAPTATASQSRPSHSRTTATSVVLAEKRAASLRAKVVRAIFPEQKVNSSNLEYDPEANSYRWANNKDTDTTCSICIDKFQEDDVVVTSLCNHAFHSDCIAGWSQIKADCPVCRQNMWDPKTYSMLEKEIKEGAATC